MSYLGVTPKIGNIRKLDDVATQFNGVAVTFNLRVGGQVIFPGSPLQMLISLGGVLQKQMFPIKSITIRLRSPISDTW